MKQASFLFVICVMVGCKPKPDPRTVRHPRDAYAWGDVMFGIPKDSLQYYGIPGIETIGLNKFLLTGTVDDSVGLWQIELRNIGVAKIDRYDLDNYKEMLKGLDTVVTRVYGEGEEISNYPASDYAFEYQDSKTFKEWLTAEKRITLSVEKGEDNKNYVVFRVTNESLAMAISRRDYKEEEEKKKILKRAEKLLIDKAAKKI